MKRFLIVGLVLFSAVFFFSCGNALMELSENGGGGSSSGGDNIPDNTPTTVSDGLTSGLPLTYIDTNDQLKAMLGDPKPHFYILRGNGVPNRTFTIDMSASQTFSGGVLTGWYKDETPTGNKLTKIQSESGKSLFTQMHGATVSWLKFEATIDVTKSGPDTVGIDYQHAGIVAGLATNTKFERVSVSGTVVIDDFSWPQTVPVLVVKKVYTGGIVGKTEGMATFQNCSGKGVTVSVSTSGSSSVTEAYAGGIAGQLATGTFVSTPVTETVVTASGAPDTYAGGYAGAVSVSASVYDSAPVPVGITVTAETAYTNGNAYAGGVAGETSGTFGPNWLSGSIDVTAKVTSSTGDAYAGGIVGKTASALSHNWLSGSIDVTAASSTASSTTGEAYAGGIAGLSGGTIGESFVFSPYSVKGVNASVEAADSVAAAGGIAGKTEGTISKSYAVVSVVNASAADASTTPPSSPYGAIAGGIAGIGGASIDNTFADTKVDARINSNTNSVPVYAGGIVGYLLNTCSVQNSYAAGSVLAHTDTNNTVFAGGIVGYSAMTDTAVVAANSVAFQGYIGTDGTMNRVIGAYSSGGSLSNNYAYENMTKYSEGSPIGAGGSADANGANISRSAFSAGTGLSSWDSSIWGFSSGSYPYLQGIFPH
ncbi:MAG: hypothetical protein LBT00_05110 [Spirochaetaceae bacterium]|nr:hypothetical protein [Spirochaetaceae bacterium]